MKKIFLFINFVFFVFFVIYSGTNVKGNGSESNLYQYYNNLNTNYSENKYGTCTFVSTSMLLAYYDTYLNDDIIPEQYDITSTLYNVSPGVFNENITDVENEVQYKYKLLEMKSKSLQALLIAISDKLGYNTLEITTQQRINILNYYFENIVGFFQGYEYEFKYIINGINNQNTLKNFIKNEIDMGNPVIVHYDHFIYLSNGPFSDYSHALVAYDYDNLGIYAHYGDKNAQNNTRFNIGDEYYFKLKDVFSIDFNVQHKHSNNISVYHDTNKHAVNCSCGEVFYENHVFNLEGICNICKCIGDISQPHSLKLDPSIQQTCGTQVSVFGGELNSNIITVGYTRCAYFEYTGQEISRLAWDWISYDENIAYVTQYGTIIAKNAGTTIIQASSKANPNVVTRINVVVENDYSFTEKALIMTTDSREDAFNGTEVTINGGIKGEKTIGSGYSRALCFSNSNQYPSLNDFYIFSSNPSALTIDRYGYLCASDVQTETEVTVSGYSRYNSKLIFIIQIIVYPVEGETTI